MWLVFHNVKALGGLTFTQVLLVFGIADVCFSLADMFFGHLDSLPTYLRQGTLDVFYLRPQPLLLQLITSDISLRRLSRASVGLASMVIALWLNDIHWSAATVGLLAMTMICSTAIYCAVYVWAAGAQFFLVNGAEFTNAFVYGGRYAATQPASVWNKPLKVVFGFIFPMAITAYVPTLALLGLPGPSWLPAWLAWTTPLFAAWSWIFGLAFWRFGVRHYQGGGG
ncbi:ABC transporter permease [Metallococcus carri]|uniref:ABC transporter permease n=1 Tax=Metallococcus carri TaxID=1656884 RepID=UPI002E2CAFBE|nr:ABC-2 family transporter protein [Metallococcus carri]